MNKQFSIGFIGAGNMASALAGGMLSNGFPSENIILSDINADQLLNVEKRFSIKTTTDNQKLVAENDIVVLAVKPQVLEQVIQSVANVIDEKKPLLISIAAGITIASIEKSLGKKTPIIRCMPNTPALVQLGASALFANEAVNNIQKQQAASVFSAVGITEWLDSEDKMDAVTALSGSGPAYYFLMMESMIAAGIKLGLSPSMAKALTLQTALGAAAMAQQSDAEPDELRRRVTSPNGTTEAALNVLTQADYHKLIDEAMSAACKRSIELSKNGKG